MIHFTPQNFEQAAQIKKLGYQRPPEPGVYYHNVSGDCGVPTPFQTGVYLVVDVDDFVAGVGGIDAFNRDFSWLPTWEDGFNWLLENDLPMKYIYSTVREGVLFYGENERELICGEIIRILEVDRAKLDL